MRARSLRAVPAFAGLVLTLAAVLAGPRPALQARPGRDMAVAAPESVGVSSERLKRLDAGMQGLVTEQVMELELAAWSTSAASDRASP